MSKDAKVFDAYAALRKHPDWHDKRDSILHREIAATLGYASGDVVRGIVNRERERRKQAPALTLVHRARSNDHEQWNDTISDLQRRGYAKVAHKCDYHAPYTDEDAAELDYQTTEYMKPDVIVVGSDFADFPTISAYAPDPDLGNDDILETLRPHWWAHIDALKRAAPKAVLVWIEGNHETRLWRFLDETAPQVRNTMREAFIDLIRYQNRVLYLGRVSEVKVGALTVLHGDNACLGDMSARKLLMARRYQGWFMFGHNHKWSQYITVGHHSMVGAAGSGHMGTPIPHYQKVNKFNYWTQGTVYAHVDMNADYVAFDNLVFQRRGGLLMTKIGKQTFAQEAVSAAATKAA